MHVTTSILYSTTDQLYPNPAAGQHAYACRCRVSVFHQSDSQYEKTANI